jgi:hypothetical protein
MGVLNVERTFSTVGIPYAYEKTGNGYAQIPCAHSAITLGTID